MSKENLQGMNKTELMAKAKELGIPRYKDGKQRTKEALIEAILNVESENGAKPEPLSIPKNVPAIVLEVLEEQENGLSDEERLERHSKYVENVKVGTLVAFKTGPNKAKSAMVQKRSTKNRKLKVVTKYGKEFIISFDDVIWVHTNKRWPRGVYNMLKGTVEKDEGANKVD